MNTCIKNILIILLLAPVNLLPLPRMIFGMHVDYQKLSQNTAIVAGTALLSGIITKIWTDHHHPAALERKKLELTYAQKQKEVEKQKALEAQKKQLEHTINQERALVHDIRRNYAQEIELAQSNRLHVEKAYFITIIKSKSDPEQIETFATYHQRLRADLDKLKKISNQAISITEKDSLIAVLQSIEKIHNLNHRDFQRAESQLAHNLKMIQESEQNKREKERLEIEKAKAEIYNAHNLSKALNQTIPGLQRQIDGLGTQVHSQFLTLQNNVELIKQNQAREQKLIQEQSKDIRRWLDSIKDFLSNLIKGLNTNADANAAKVVNQLFDALSRPPATNPELNNPAPSASSAPSAPPL